MPLPYPSGGRTLILRLTLCALTLALPHSSFSAVRTAQHAALSPFEKAQRLREALEGRPEQQRTRRDYERVLDAYRTIVPEAARLLTPGGVLVVEAGSGQSGHILELMSASGLTPKRPPKADLAGIPRAVAGLKSPP